MVPRMMGDRAYVATIFFLMILNFRQKKKTKDKRQIQDHSLTGYHAIAEHVN